MIADSEKQALEILTGGGVGVMPTDTVYGLVARVADRLAVGRFYALKHREHKPGTVVAASVEQLIELGLDERELRAVAHLWPNPLSVVIKAGPELDYLHQGLNSLVVRVPKDRALRTLLEQTGPLVTSSANQPGEPPAVNVVQARNYFGESIDFYVDGGDLSGRAPSTIVRVVRDEVEVIRQGAVKLP
jgi:L-threonylcarbamoyladenylate synthase